jgi:hypothetical protein
MSAGYMIRAHLFLLDNLRTVLFVGVATIIVAMFCLIYVGIANSSSRNISLALGTMLGSLLLLFIQTGFELQPPSKSVAVIRTEFTTDRAKPKIEQFRYPLTSMRRFENEAGANEFLLATNPAAFQGDGEKLWEDISLFSLVAYLWSEQHDWQIARDRVGNYERFQYLSPPDQPSQCTKVELSEIQTMLRRVGNVFADYAFAPSVFGVMCLPPRSSIRIEPDGVEIETPFCKLRFAVEQLWIEKASWRPGTNGGDHPLLENGQSRFETRTGILRATVKYHWTRAQSREMPKYQTWANDVVERAQVVRHGDPARDCVLG